MKPEEALDLIPLYAGGDLEPETLEAVRNLVASDGECAALAQEYEELEDLLEYGLTPEPTWAPAWLEYMDANIEPALAAAAGGDEVRVRRRCPYCHDDLQSDPVVFCSSCATPHHAACFQEHGVCVTPACGGTEAVATRVTPPSNRRFLVAATLVLAMGLGVGAALGLKQRADVQDDLRRSREASRADVRTYLEDVAGAQQLYRRRDLDGNGLRDFCPDLPTLEQTLESSSVELDPAGHHVDDAYTITVARSSTMPGGRFYAVAQPKPLSPEQVSAGIEPRVFFINHEGKVQELDATREWSIDSARCTVRFGDDPP